MTDNLIQLAADRVEEAARGTSAEPHATVAVAMAREGASLKDDGRTSAWRREARAASDAEEDLDTDTYGTEDGHWEAASMAHLYTAIDRLCAAARTWGRPEFSFTGDALQAIEYAAMAEAARRMIGWADRPTGMSGVQAVAAAGQAARDEAQGA